MCNNIRYDVNKKCCLNCAYFYSDYSMHKSPIEWFKNTENKLFENMLKNSKKGDFIKIWGTRDNYNQNNLILEKQTRIDIFNEKPYGIYASTDNTEKPIKCYKNILFDNYSFLLASDGEEAHNKVVRKNTCNYFLNFKYYEEYTYKALWKMHKHKIKLDNLKLAHKNNQLTTIWVIISIITLIFSIFINIISMINQNKYKDTIEDKIKQLEEKIKHTTT